MPVRTIVRRTMTQRPEPTAPTYLTQAEAADLLRVSQRTIARYVEAGALVALRTPGGRPRFRPEDIEALLTIPRYGTAPAEATT